MANHSQKPQSPHSAGKAAASDRRPSLDSAVFPEPEVRRWPHPVPGTAPVPPPCSDASLLQYIRCAISYQNQLLAEIKTQLEQLTLNAGGHSTEK